MKIINIDTGTVEQTRLSEQSGIALTRDTSYLTNLMNQEFLVEGISLVLIESGCASFIIQSDECHIEAGEIIIVNYGQCVKNMMVSPTFQFRAFFLSREFFESLLTRLELNWSLRSGIFFFSHLKYHPSEGEFDILCRYYDLLDSKRLQTRQQQLGIDALCEAFGYEILDQMEIHGYLSNNTAAVRQGIHDASHQHFEAFMNMLITDQVVDRMVSHYADRLNISSKYLNLICHQVTQLNPSELISRELLQRATKMLHDSSLSIKQISHQLGFTNQSHFGTFTRRMTGKSPLQLREETTI